MKSNENLINKNHEKGVCKWTILINRKIKSYLRQLT